jgi:histidine ammonia-lyase
MGTNSALITKKVISNTYDVLAIEMITLLQAIDYLKYQDMLSDYTKEVYTKMRKVVPVFSEDTTKSKDIKNMRKYMEKNRIRPDHKLPNLL